MEKKHLIERWIEWDTKDDETAPYVWRVRWFLYGVLAMIASQWVR